MSEQQPPKWFTGQESEPDDKNSAKRRKAFLAELPKLLEKQKGRGRAKSFYPYLLVRSVLGDRGDRSINTPFWESPDIWTAPGDPSTSPAILADHGGTVTAGEPATVYAHVWNLGFAPLAGIFVEFWWFNPSLGIDGTDGHLIGTARCELAARGMSGSHKLVKCPKPWIPVMENAGHECLVVRVFGFGDPLGANEWAPWINRHVAQRNCSVVSAKQGAGRLITSLGATLRLGGRVQLVQLGAREGAMAAEMVAPMKRVSPGLETRVLAELNDQQQVVLEHPSLAPPAALAPIHALAQGGAPAAPTLRPAPGAALASPGRLLPDISTASLRAEASAPLASLLNAVEQLNPDARQLGRPGRGEVHVLRLANYDAEGQLVGGYTMLIPD